jgi:hypothetical protein
MNAPRLAVPVVLAAGLLTAACADDDSPAVSTVTVASAPATSAPVTPAVVSWAGDVCAGADQVRAAVDDLAAVVPVELGSDQAVRDQVRTQAEQRAGALRDQVAELSAALRALPPEADPAVTAARDDLETASAAARTQVTALADAAAALPAATTQDELRAALRTLRSVAVSARAAATAFASEISRVLAGTDAAVRSAFAAAPQCQAVGATASPSS